MMKTPLVDRMLKKGAPKAWSIEVELLQGKIDYLTATKEEYVGIIDALARQVERLHADNDRLYFACKQALMGIEEGYLPPKITDDLRNALKDGEQ